MASTPLTLYLFREGLELSKHRLRRPTEFEDVSLVEPPDDGVSWELYVRQRPRAEVEWLARLRAIMANPESTAVFGQSAGAVLLVEAHGRVWAATFGTGHHAIDRSEHEPDFGLRVAANKINPQRVTLAETRGLDKGTRNAVSILPVPSRMFALRVAINEEWVRRFGGKVLDADFGISVAGADSLRLNLTDFSLRSLPAKLKDILGAFTATTYKESFPFLDYFRQLPRQDPLVPILNDQVDELLQARSPTVGFASPDDLQQFHPDDYELHFGRKSVDVVELATDQVYIALDQLDAWERPRALVRVAPRGGDVPTDERHTLGQCLVANVRTLDDGIESEFALTADKWFKIDQAYAERVQRYIDGVKDITAELDLPDWDDGWLKANDVPGDYAEARYNHHVSANRGYALLDREFYYGPSWTGQQVEVCDLLTKDKQLICVKRLDGAESMIHLFEQGALSAGMMRDEAYRQRVLADLQTGAGGSSFGENGDWTFVFAIATSKPQPVRDLLTFFAKVALTNNADAIEGRGFRLAIAKINRVAPV